MSYTATMKYMICLCNLYCISTAFPYQIFTFEIPKRIILAGAELLSSVPLLRGNVRLKWDLCVAGGIQRLVREADVFSQIGQSVSTNQRRRALSVSDVTIAWVTHLIG